jgi:hypothetical protein
MQIGLTIRWSNDQQRDTTKETKGKDTNGGIQIFRKMCTSSSNCHGFHTRQDIASSYHDVVLLPLSKDNITHLQKQSPLLFLHLLSAFTCFVLSRGSASSKLWRISAFGLRFSTPQQWAFRIHNNWGIDLGKQHTHALLRLDHQR